MSVLKNIGMGLGIIVATPIAVAGGVLYGVGMVLKGIGNLMTFRS